MLLSKGTRLIHQQLHRIAKNRWALSTVVTSLIVLVISVLLAGVVTYFAINVTSTRVQEESLDLAKQHVWFDFASSKTQAAIMIINSGGRDVVIEKLTVRGQQCDWSKVFYNQTSNSIASDLSYASSLSDGASVSIGGANYVFKQAASAITLQSGRTLLIYLNNPDSISVNDIGLTVSVNIFTSQAMYYKETNVQGTSGTASASTVSSIEIPYAAGIYCEYYSNCEVALVLINSGSTDETIGVADLLIKGQTPLSTPGLYYYTGVFTATSQLPYYAGIGTIQGQTLLEDGTCTIHPGETAIVYFVVNSGSSTIGASDVGENIAVGIKLDNGQTLTTTVQVTSYTG